MKKTKLILLSTIIFIAIFCLTVILDIKLPISFDKDNLFQTNSVIKTEAANQERADADSEIHSLAIEISSIPTNLSEEPTSTPNENQNVKQSTDPVAANTPSIAPTITPTVIPTSEPTSEPTAAPEQKDKKKENETEPKPDAKYDNIGISVAKDYVNIRRKASTDSDILGKLHKGSAATIRKSKGDWYYIESGSVKGYIKKEFIKTGIPDDELMKKYGTLSISVAVDGLNVRTKPSTDAKKVTVIYMNETYPVVKQKNDWFEINIIDENKTGFIRKEFAELIVKFKEAVSKEEEEKLAQLAAEERAKKETEICYSGGVSYSEEDLKLLACLIHAEAGSQSYEGKLAVANIVLNRVKSPKYADTIKAVIYQSGQFSVASSGSLQKQLNNYSSYRSKSQLLSLKTAKDALEGANNIGNRLYFHSYSAAVRKGYDDKSSSVKIGGLMFW